MSNVVQVYRNIHKSRAEGVPVYSIRDKRTRRVIGHASEVLLADAVFRVSESGRQRVLAEKRKNVHAWVEGTLTDVTGWDAENAVGITYNPYKYSTFVDVVTQGPVVSARAVRLSDQVTAVCG